MVDLIIGGETFEDVDRIQLNKADLTGVASFMESADFMDIMQSPTPLSTKKAYYENPYLTSLGESGAQYVSNFTTVFLENVTNITYSRIQNTIACENIIMPRLVTLTQHFTYGANGKCKRLDFTDLAAIENHSLGGTMVETVIIRGSTVPTLNTSGQRSSGVTVYVPSAMIASYQADTNWSAMSNWTFTALEGSQYADPDWFRS